MSCLRRLRVNKLLKQKDFIECYDKGLRVFSKHFIVYIHKRPMETYWRFGLSVSKKVGSAVIRNRIKRLVREFFRIHQGYIQKTIDIIVVPKSHMAIEKMDLHQVNHELLSILCEVRGKTKNYRGNIYYEKFL